MHFSLEFQTIEKHCCNNCVFSAQGTSDLSKFMNIKRHYINLGKERHAVTYNKTIGAFYFDLYQDLSTQEW